MKKYAVYYHTTPNHNRVITVAERIRAFEDGANAATELFGLPGLHINGADHINNDIDVDPEGSSDVRYGDILSEYFTDGFTCALEQTETQHAVTEEHCYNVREAIVLGMLITKNTDCCNSREALRNMAHAIKEQCDSVNECTQIGIKMILDDSPCVNVR